MRRLGVVGGDAPEVEIFETFGFGVENGGGEETDGGGEFFVFGIGGGLHVVAGGIFFVVEEKRGGDDMVGGVFSVKVVIMNEKKGSERLGELVFKVGVGEGVDAFFRGELVLETSEMGDVGGVGRDGDGEAFFGELVVAGASALRKTRKKSGDVRREVENPGVGGV